MAGLLRTSKVIRFVTGIARNLAFNSYRNDSHLQLLQGQLGSTRLLASQATSEQLRETSSSLERTLWRLDQDARRTGRISRRELEEVLEEIRLTRTATSSQSLMVIRCCGNLVPDEMPEVRTKLVQEIWNTLKKLGVALDVSHYNALLRVYLENGHDFSPTEFLAELEKSGVEPNRVTFQRLISRYCQQGDIEGAMRILEFMREKQLPVSEGVFNSLITGHSEANDMESARGILGVMQQAGLEPTAETYTALLCGYAKKGDIEEIKKILSECDTKDIYLLDKDYMDIVYTLATNGFPEHVDEIIPRMRQLAAYNQDAVNLILRLINAGREDVGMRIFLTMPRPSRPDGQQQPTGYFFVKQMVKAGRPLESIIGVCQKLKAEGLNERGLSIATETALTLGKTDLAFPLLSAFKEEGVPLRQHYFWPLLVAHGKKRDEEGLFAVLQQMLDLGLPPSIETVEDYVIPYLQGTPFQVLQKLRPFELSPGSMANAVLYHLLSENKIKEASELVNTQQGRYLMGPFCRPLVDAYRNTRDAKSLVDILRHSGDGGESGGNSRMELTGQYVVECVKGISKDKVSYIQPVLENLVSQGLSISNSTAHLIEEQLGESLNSDISDLLAKLASGDLTPRPLSATQEMSERSIAGLENMLEISKKQGRLNRGIQRQLMSQYCRHKDLVKAENLKQELEAEGFVFTSSLLAQILDMYCQFDRLSEAEACMKQLSEREPDFVLDNYKVIRFALLLVKEDKLDDALEVLSKHARTEEPEMLTYTQRALCWQLLNVLAEKGQVEELQKLFRSLVDNKIITPSTALLGPLIKVHLVRNDIPSALSAFEQCCREHQCTPYKTELAMQLIKAEDSANLQRLTDLSSLVHGEVNSLYDLVLAFVECGHTRQARRILETPGLQGRSQRLKIVCQRYAEDGQVEPLEGLLDATRDLTRMDRSDFCFQLLRAYIKVKNSDKALGLWTRMQEEDIRPSDEFLSLLANFLKDEGLEVPFAVPEPTTTPHAEAPVKQTVEAPKGNSRQFRRALNLGQIDQALNIEAQAEKTGDTLTVGNASVLIESLVHADRLPEATQIVEKMLIKESTPSARVFRFFLNRLAKAGDIDSLTRIAETLTADKKRVVSFDNRLCNAYLKAGKAKEYLSNLEQEISQAEEKDLEHISEKFPRGGAYGILDTEPALLPQFMTLCEKYASRGLHAPMNVLWSYHFISKEFEEADKLWKQYLADKPQVMFQRVGQAARENSDEDLARRLIGLLEQSAVGEAARGNAYSCLLDVLSSQGRYKDALDVLESAHKDIPLNLFNRSALMRIKTGLSEQGKNFPYTIPLKNEKEDLKTETDEREDKI